MSTKAACGYRVTSHDVAAVRKLVQEAKTQPSFLERQHDNVEGPPPTFSKESFWHTLTGCLLTTQQRSSQGSPIQILLNEQPYPLRYEECAANRVGPLVQAVLSRYRGIRFAPTIAKRAEANWRRLQHGGWAEVERPYKLLRDQRGMVPAPEHKRLERDIARWTDGAFEGFGPKQSRNLWQWLGLTRYEIPIDSRVAKWVNAENLSVEIEPSRLIDETYYERVLDHLQAICAAAEVLPCMFDIAAFDYEDRRTTMRGEGIGVGPGTVNRFGQVVVRVVGNEAQFACSGCGHTYLAAIAGGVSQNCPKCQ